MRKCFFAVCLACSLIVGFAWSGSAFGAIQCYQCHGSSIPSDYRPVDANIRDSATGGFPGNHRTHMNPDATPASCNDCHPGAESYGTGHMDGAVKVAANIRNSPLPATYRNSTSAFPQGSRIEPGTCMNVICHFERVTPLWGSAPFTTSDCNACHGAPPAGGDTGSAGSHGRHDLYYTGAARCSQCHANHLAEASPFAHATSVGRRNLLIELRDPFGQRAGTYSGSLDDFLPKSSQNAFGTCSGTYCHSSGTSVASGTVEANTTPLWGSGTLACDECHGNPPLYDNGSPKANSHRGHSIIHPFTCDACHVSTTADGIAISDLSRHVNGEYDLAPGSGITFTYSYASTGGSCTNISCHSDAVWGGTMNGGIGCEPCHGHSPGFEYLPDMFSQGKGSWKSHATHTQADGANVRGPNVACNACHDFDNFPYFKSGNDTDSDGRISLNETTVCDACHSPGGAYDGVGDAEAGARTNWKFAIYSGSGLRSGKGNWCLTCHDDAPSLVNGSSAPNKAGNGTSYGYNLTGHGRYSSFVRLSLQDSSAAGNPGAKCGCMDCHDSQAPHIASAVDDSRLKAGFENDRNNSNCVQCHAREGIANHSPFWFTTFDAYSASAHGKVKCADCHDVHGSSGPYTGMLRADNEQLCYQCHRNGAVENNPLSASGLPASIHDVFTMPSSSQHDIGAPLTVNGKEYTLQCASCHNVHLVTGRYASATTGKTPVTRFGSFTTLWGAAAGQKMGDYAVAQFYQPPLGEMPEAVMPDYATFCSDCHNATSTIYSPSLGRIVTPFDWRTQKHGSNPAKDDKGGMVEMASPYSDNALGSYVMTCTDCHEAHASKNSFTIRTNVNSGSVDGITTGDGYQWSVLCHRCHQNARSIHHSLPGADCSQCHGPTRGTFVNCTRCHNHQSMTNM